MRTTKTISVTLPPEMLARAELIARKEHRTMSELIREALRHYERRAWWDEVNTYGRRTAERAGITSEEDVVNAVRQVRRARAARRRAS